ncbi:hypothetical protein D0466_00035 [Peribacillus glennii]|uniref:Uncharacterized protein n=1 Tax=Peribacillus glennii TaxID=2303991 RepID=A0A372LL98_9BACI|nr:hypothetical protein D0466_00035 [Peribacillus glennii]
MGLTPLLPDSASFKNTYFVLCINGMLNIHIFDFHYAGIPLFGWLFINFMRNDPEEDVQKKIWLQEKDPRFSAGRSYFLLSFR